MLFIPVYVNLALDIKKLTYVAPCIEVPQLLWSLFSIWKQQSAPRQRGVHDSEKNIENRFFRALVLCLTQRIVVCSTSSYIKFIKLSYRKKTPALLGVSLNLFCFMLWWKPKVSETFFFKLPETGCQQSRICTLHQAHSLHTVQCT